MAGIEFSRKVFLDRYYISWFGTHHQRVLYDWYQSMIYLLRLYVIFVVSVLISVCLFESVIEFSLNIQHPTFLQDRKEIKFRIDASFSNKERKLIGQALEEWERATKGYVTFSYYVEKIPLLEMFSWKDDNKPTIYNGDSLLSWQRHVGLSVAEAETIGLAFIFSGDIFIFDNKYRFKDVVVHEVGHLLVGSWHSKDKTSIMFPYIMDGDEKFIRSEEIRIVKYGVVP